MHGRFPRGFRVPLAVALTIAAAFVLLPVAGASNPGVEHATFGPVVSELDDFCGTGKTVVETFAGHLTIWNDPNQPVDSRNQSVGDDVFTSADTGVTVVNHGAYSFTDTLVSGEPGGVNTHQWTFKGSAAIVRIVGSAVISRDRGFLVVRTTWAGDEFDSELLDIEVVRDAGGHPDFTADFCAQMVPALGLG
jgi:hypothetical protein